MGVGVGVSSRDDVEGILSLSRNFLCIDPPVACPVLCSPAVFMGGYCTFSSLHWEGFLDWWVSRRFLLPDLSE